MIKRASAAHGAAMGGRMPAGKDRNGAPAAGRPRDEAAGPALKQAARRLVTLHGYENVSIGAILAEAGVSRQTLYRRWPTKADLVLDAFVEAAGAVPDADALPLRAALRAILGEIFAHLNVEGAAIRSLIGSAQSDPDFRKAFREKFVLPRERMMLEILERARGRGELPPDTDIACLSAMLHGAFWYRLLNDEPLDDDFLERLVTTALPRRRG